MKKIARVRVLLTLSVHKGLLAFLIGVGLLISVWAVKGLAQSYTLNQGYSLKRWATSLQYGQAASQRPTPVLMMQDALFDQDFNQGSVRPWLLLACRGMTHEAMRYDYGEHEYGERGTPTFSRFVQSFRFFPLLVLIGLVAIILLAYRLYWYKPLLPVIVVARREIQGVVKSLGTVQALEPVTIRSQRSGTIERLHVAQGDKVTRGQVLAELRPSTLKKEAKATPEDLVQLVAGTEVVIANCVLSVGDEVYPGTPIFQTVEVEHIRIAARISEARGAQVRAGQAAVIKMSSEQEFRGEVVQIKKDFDPALTQYELMVKFIDMPDPEVIGEEAVVIIATGQQTAPAVPITAITSRNDQQGVLVAADGLVHFRPIVLGVQNGKWAATLEGIREGELVIVTPEATKPGKEVRAEVVTETYVEG